MISLAKNIQYSWGKLTVKKSHIIGIYKSSHRAEVKEGFAEFPEFRSGSLGGWILTLKHEEVRFAKTL